MSEADLPEREQAGAAVGNRELLEAISRGLAEVLAEQREAGARLVRLEAALGITKQAPVETSEPNAGPLHVPSPPHISTPPHIATPPPLPTTPRSSVTPISPATEVRETQAQTGPPPLPVGGLRELLREDAQPVPPIATSAAAPPEAFETRFGLNWLNRVAAVTLIFGAAFFFKYAVDNEWIGPGMRVASGIVAAMLSLVAGEWMFLRGQKVFAQGVTGLGLALLYLSFYASTDFYHLLSVETAFLLMFATTIAAGWLALHYDAQPVAILGLLGGFVTPALLSTGKDHVGLLACYTLLLCIGASVLVSKRKWAPCIYLAFAATWILYDAWAADWLHDDTRMAAFAWISGIFVVFVTGCALRKSIALLALNAVSYFAASYYLLDQTHHEVMGLFAVAVGLVHGALALASLKDTAEPKQKEFGELSAAIAAVCLTLAFPIQFAGFRITMAWALEAAGLAFLGRKSRNEKYEVAAWCVFALVVARLVASDAWMYGSADAYTGLLNTRFLTFAVSAASLWTASYLSSLPLSAIAWNAAGHLAMLSALVLESDGWTTRTFGPGEAVSAFAVTLTILGGAYALGLVMAGVAMRTRTLRIWGLALTGLVIAKLYLYDVWILNRGFRIIAFLVLGALLLLVSFLYTRYKPAIDRLWKDRLWKDPAAPSPSV